MATTYLVTGGCGFIGSHLCAALVGRGDHVRVLDDLSTGHRHNLPPDTELVVGDVADPALVRTAMHGVQGCFHLAAVASVERGVREWFATHRVNLSGSIAVFDAARQAGPRPVPVVYASSAAVYGDNSALPLDEGAATRPLSAYGADKLGSEQHARVAGVVHGVPTAGLRFFNVFGPRQDPRSPYSGVISIFCDRLMRGQPIDVFGDGQQTRDFIFVADIVAGLVAAMREASRDAPVFNLCTGQPTSILALAEVIAALCDQALAVRHGAPRSGEVRHSLGAPGLARAVLGVVPTVDLRQGLAETIAWMRNANSDVGKAYT
jgi:UDP-glucose 4-epimerase